tara:strand:- start:297 stop:1001 length:705 start_codon:yes stop_codon:yes gene_type:complete
LRENFPYQTQRILIFGFWHCGTSILKSIIGHAKEVDEVIDERDKLPKVISPYKFSLCKSPLTQEKFFEGEYKKDYQRIFILRNPVWVFSSLNRRFKGKIPKDHSIELYERAAKKFLYYRENPQDNLYTILYEELFEDNHKKIKEILDFIGIKWENQNIFDNKGFKNQIVTGLKGHIPKKEPSQLGKHGDFRQWQINQPFRNMNDKEKIQISQKQKQKMLKSKAITKLYKVIESC